MLLTEDERGKIVIKEELEKAKKGEHKCSDPDCLISIAIPLATIEGIEDCLITILLFLFKERHKMAEEGIKISLGCFSINEELVESAEVYLVDFANSIIDESLRDSWRFLVLASRGDKAATKAVLYLSLFLLGIEQVAREIAAVKAAIFSNN